MAAISKFTPEIQGAILGALRTGVSYDVACHAAGVTRQTMWRWVKLGERDQAAGMDTEHARFLREVRVAEASTIAGIEQSLMRTAASGADWRASAWVLGKKMPDDYGAVNVTKMRNDAMIELLNTVQRAAPPAFYEQLLEILISTFDDVNEEWLVEQVGEPLACEPETLPQ